MQCLIFCSLLLSSQQVIFQGDDDDVVLLDRTLSWIFIVKQQSAGEHVAPLRKWYIILILCQLVFSLSP